jgi:hypothetical protein
MSPGDASLCPAGTFRPPQAGVGGWWSSTGTGEPMKGHGTAGTAVLQRAAGAARNPGRVGPRGGRREDAKP